MLAIAPHGECRHGVPSFLVGDFVRLSRAGITACHAVTCCAAIDTDASIASVAHDLEHAFAASDAAPRADHEANCSGVGSY